MKLADYVIHLKKFKKELYIHMQQKVLPRVAEELHRRVVERTVAGKGVTGPKRKVTNFKKLKKSTVESRIKKLQNGKLHGLTTPDMSNQTETGKLVHTMLFDSGKDWIKIYPNSDREDVARYQVEMGRQIFNISKNEYLWAMQEIHDQVQKFIKDYVELK